MTDSILEINTTQKQQATIVTLKGKIDASTAPQLKTELNTNITNGNVKLVCDMSAVSYISSAGIGALMAAQAQAKKEGGEVRLAGLSKEVKDIFDLMKFSVLFKMTASLNEALEGL